MSWFSDWLHPGKGYEKGQEELEKYFNQAQGALNPYNQNGMDQYNNLNDYIKKLMNPEQLQNEWAARTNRNSAGA